MQDRLLLIFCLVLQWLFLVEPLPRLIGKQPEEPIIKTLQEPADGTPAEESGRYWSLPKIRILPGFLING